MQISRWQVIQKVNGVRDWAKMVTEISRAPVLKMLINQRLSSEQHRFAVALRSYREARKVLACFKAVRLHEVHQCPICLEAMRSKVVRSPCGHDFHKHCISRWVVDMRSKCPLCKFELRKPAEKAVEGDESKALVRVATV